MLDGLAYAFAVIFRLILCTVIALGGAYWIISSWFDRRLSLGEAVMLLVGLVLLMFMSVPLALHAGLGALILLLLLIVGAAVFFYYFSKVLNARALKQMDDADIAMYQAALELDPNNVAAHSLMGNIYRKRGQMDFALQEYEAALKLDPTLQEEHYWVSRYKGKQEQAPGGEIPCPRCGALGPPAASRCQGCGELISEYVPKDFTEEGDFLSG